MTEMPWEQRVLQSDMAQASPQAALRLLEKAKELIDPDEEGRVRTARSSDVGQALHEPSKVGEFGNEGEGSRRPSLRTQGT